MGCGASKATASFYAKFYAAFEAKEIDAISACYTDDCEWVWHSSGKSMGKEAFVAMMPNFFKMPPAKKQRCVFHAFNKFPDETVEGTMMVMKLRDGKCYHVETGSTLIPKDSPNYIG